MSNNKPRKFYISDLHLNHEKVIKFDNRPFNNLEQMHETILNNWNNMVTNADTVYILGDIIWIKDDSIISLCAKLKGHKILIQGNHDHHALQDLRIRNIFDEILPYTEVRDTDDNNKQCNVILSHYPMIMWNKQHKGSIHLYGHVHNSREWKFYQDTLKDFKKFIDTENKNIKRQEDFNPIAINVGCMVDYMNYTPRTLKELLSFDYNKYIDRMIPKY